jgi:hypothetical protein
LFGSADDRARVSLCHAKITPAALHCSDFGDLSREAVEVTAYGVDFGSSGPQCEIVDRSMQT